jgi:hypothetical protein
VGESPYASPFDDEPAIAADERLYRRIFPDWIDWTKIDAGGLPRIKRAAFQDYSAKRAVELGYPGACMSVGLGSVLAGHGREPLAMLEKVGQEYGLASLTAAEVRARDQGVMAWPTEEEPWHAVVFSRLGPKR